MRMGSAKLVPGRVSDLFPCNVANRHLSLSLPNTTLMRLCRLYRRLFHCPAGHCAATA